MFLLGNGRIMGASLIGGLVDGSGWSNLRSIVFLAGVVIMPIIVLQFWDRSETNITDNVLQLVAAGLLVGVGHIANGCTSGHGVCGISRLSLRGIVATVFYIMAGGLTMALFRAVLGGSNETSNRINRWNALWWGSCCFGHDRHRKGSRVA